MTNNTANTTTTDPEKAIEILENFDFSSSNTKFDEEFGEMTVKQSFEISLTGREWKKFFPLLVKEGKIKTMSGEVWNEPYFPNGYSVIDDRVYTLSPYLSCGEICVSLYRS